LAGKLCRTFTSQVRVVKKLPLMPIYFTAAKHGTACRSTTQYQFFHIVLLIFTIAVYVRRL
jgi:hypothetical protein